MHRCDADGGNIRQISANIEQDNTPWPLPDGRVLYLRWEYVDRSQVDYHHLWTANPDGTGETVYFGNQHPGTVMIDAKPIPKTNKVVAIFSPGHGQREHDGAITVVDVRKGPDEQSFARTVARGARLSRSLGLFRRPVHGGSARADRAPRRRGPRRRRSIASAPTRGAAGLECHEPRPIMRRQREQRDSRSNRSATAKPARSC